MKNKEFAIARRSLFVAVFFFFLCFLPSLADWDMMNGGFALIFISIVVILTALITSGMFFVRGLALAKLLKKQGGFLAEWGVSPDLWRKIIERQFENEKANNRILMGIVWFFCILAAIGFLIFDPEPGLWVAAVMLLLMVITGICAFSAPRLRRSKLLNSTPAIKIGKYCVLYGPEFHAWGSMGSRFESLELVEDDLDPSLRWMQLAYSYPVKGGRQTTEILIPVPESEIATAERIAPILASAKA